MITSELISRLVNMLIDMIIRTLTPKFLDEFLFKTIDFVEDKVLGSNTKIDDAMILPITNVLRDILEPIEKA